MAGILAHPDDEICDVAPVEALMGATVQISP
jgi:hypothetical protein